MIIILTIIVIIIQFIDRRQTKGHLCACTRAARKWQVYGCGASAHPALVCIREQKVKAALARRRTGNRKAAHTSNEFRVNGQGNNLVGPRTANLALFGLLSFLLHVANQKHQISK